MEVQVFSQLFFDHFVSLAAASQICHLLRQLYQFLKLLIIGESLVELHELVTADGTVIATELDLVVGPRVAFYQAGRLTDHEWRGSGSVLRYRILERAIDRGALEYDLLRGDEPYKAEWSTGSRQLLRCRFAVGLPARALLGAHGARVRLTGLARSLDRREELSDPAPSTPGSAAPHEPHG